MPAVNGWTLDCHRATHPKHICSQWCNVLRPTPTTKFEIFYNAYYLTTHTKHRKYSTKAIHLHFKAYDLSVKNVTYIYLYLILSMCWRGETASVKPQAKQELVCNKWLRLIFYTCSTIIICLMTSRTLPLRLELSLCFYVWSSWSTNKNSFVTKMILWILNSQSAMCTTLEIGNHSASKSKKQAWSIRKLIIEQIILNSTSITPFICVAIQLNLWQLFNKLLKSTLEHIETGHDLCA